MVYVAGLLVSFALVLHILLLTFLAELWRLILLDFQFRLLILQIAIA